MMFGTFNEDTDDFNSTPNADINFSLLNETQSLLAINWVRQTDYLALLLNVMECLLSFAQRLRKWLSFVAGIHEHLPTSRASGYFLMLVLV